MPKLDNRAKTMRSTWPAGAGGRGLSNTLEGFSSAATAVPTAKRTIAKIKEVFLMLAQLRARFTSFRSRRRGNGLSFGSPEIP